MYLLVLMFVKILHVDRMSIIRYIVMYRYYIAMLGIENKTDILSLITPSPHIRVTYTEFVKLHDR